MNDDSLITSGFVDEDLPENASAYSDIQEIYSSSSGCSCLFRCHRYGKQHVLKALKSMYRGTPFYEQLLRKEFNIGYQLEHPHICRTLGWERTDALGHCILLEYVDGITLNDFIEQGKLTRPLAIKFLTELCSALHYLHNKQIIHRDLKPCNILITHNGNNVKLIDFGLADCDDYSILKLPAGTRYYLAPEALQADVPLDLRADIYSLGVIIGEMATRLGDKRLAAVSRKCTQRKRERRYSSATEVAEALNVSRKRKIPSVVAALILLAGLAVGGFYMYSQMNVPTQEALYPVYGNQVGNEECHRLLASERGRLLHSADSLFMDGEQHWKEYTNWLLEKLRETLNEDYSLPELRETITYRRQWETLRREAEQMLEEVRRK